MIAALALLLAIAVLLVLLIVQGRRRAGQERDVAELRVWARQADPGYWRELLGPEAAEPFLDEEPEAGPADCEANGRMHVLGPGGHTCTRCSTVLVT
jgi:hypothetical protein